MTKLTDENKITFVRDIDRKLNDHQHCSDDDISLFVSYTEELAAKGNIEAMDILGYQCYGGSEAFACDWIRARDIFEELFERTGNPGYANTLGYIYYYGRCNDGVAEDDKAYKYFSYGNAAGLYESKYKLADMIRQGRYVPKNREIAVNMVEDVYFDNLELLESGVYDCKFADAALRMGGFCEERIAVEDGKTGEMADPIAAYAFYKQAKLAIDLRMESVDYYGDDVVAMNISKALDRVRPHIEFLDRDSYMDNNPGLIRVNIVPGSYLILTFTKTDDGIKVSAEKGDGSSFLVTLPEYDYCALEDTIEMYGTNVKFIREPDYDRNYCITAIDVNFENGDVIFYDTEPVALMKCTEWKYKFNTSDDVEKGEEVCIATVTFEEGGKGYDYICDYDYVKPGQTALVGGDDGMIAVTVQEVRMVKVSELPMPIHRYKKLLNLVILD